MCAAAGRWLHNCAPCKDHVVVCTCVVDLVMLCVMEWWQRYAHAGL
jgi:hypothetical protein